MQVRVWRLFLWRSWARCVSQLTARLRPFCAPLRNGRLSGRRGGFAPVREAWLARAAHPPGAAMTLRLAAGGAVAGVYRGLDESGRLLLEESGGGTAAFASGEVVGARFRVAGAGAGDGEPEGGEGAERAVLS